MVVNASRHDAAARPSAPRTPARVLWHQLECGSYRADLPLWLELAQRSEGPVLDIGAGAGRVTLELARAGHPVTALDLDPVLLEELRGRASGLSVETVAADARNFAIGRRDFALCLVPMQTIQLLEGSSGRVAFMRRARTHLRAGGLLACAILAQLEPFDCSAGELGPTAESARVDGVTYLTRAIRVSELPDRVVIERERRILVDREPGPGAATGAPSDADLIERDIVELDRVSAAQLEGEAREAGLSPEAPLEVSATSDHVGSVVVMLRA